MAQMHDTKTALLHEHNSQLESVETKHQHERTQLMAQMEASAAKYHEDHAEWKTHLADVETKHQQEVQQLRNEAFQIAQSMQKDVADITETLQSKMDAQSADHETSIQTLELQHKN